MASGQDNTDDDDDERRKKKANDQASPQSHSNLPPPTNLWAIVIKALALEINS